MARLSTSQTPDFTRRVSGVKVCGLNQHDGRRLARTGTAGPGVGRSTEGEGIMDTLRRTLLIVLLSAAAIGLAVPVAHAGTGKKKAVEKAEKKPPPGPAKKMKILRFVTLRSVSILYLQFLDKKKRPTKAPDGGSITFATNVTKPRKGKRSMSKAKWKESKKAYVFVKLPIRQKWVCPPRSYWIRVNFKAGKKRFRAFKRQKFPCLK
jgi:hypothetical protein